MQVPLFVFQEPWILLCKTDLGVPSVISAP